MPGKLLKSRRGVVLEGGGAKMVNQEEQTGRANGTTEGNLKKKRATTTGNTGE